MAVLVDLAVAAGQCILCGDPGWGSVQLGPAGPAVRLCEGDYDAMFDPDLTDQVVEAIRALLP